MKTQCPFCKKISKIPDMYKEKCIKCPGCKESFIPAPYKKAPVDISEKVVPAAHNTGFFLTKLWTRCPSAFKTGFLTTLGVISALWVAFNFIGPGTWLRRPSVQRTIHTSPVPPNLTKADPEDIDFLATTIRFSECLSVLHSLQQVRATAAEQLAQNGYWVSFLSVLQCTQAELESLYFEVHDYVIPNNPDLQAAYEDILAAIDAEYVFQKKIVAYTNNPASLQNLNDMSEQGKNATALHNMALIRATQLFIQSREGLTDAFLRIDGNKE